MEFTKSYGLHGEITVPGDKSISHRAVIFGPIAKGLTEIHNFLQDADCLSITVCFEKMGVSIENRGDWVLVQGNRLHSLRKPDCILDCGNNGATTRLILDILYTQDFIVTLTGDESIQKHLMERIIDPLSLIGAGITSLQGNGYTPLLTKGGPVHGTCYPSKVVSAQIKSAILLAGLYTDNPTSVTEPYVSRNHSKIIPDLFRAQVSVEGTTATIQPAPELNGVKVMVPGNIFSAAYFIVAGLMVPDSQMLIRNVGINPTRDGILRACQDIGADFQLLNRSEGAGEPTTDTLIRWGALHEAEIGGTIIPALIGELSMIAAVACPAEGRTVIRDAARLKVKESNRITAVVGSLRSMDADVAETEDGVIIQGGRPLHGASIDSHGGHRTAMISAAIALCADGATDAREVDCMAIPYPWFCGDLQGLMA